MQIYKASDMKANSLNDFLIFVVINGVFTLSCGTFTTKRVKIFGEEAFLDQNYSGKRNHSVSAESNGLLFEIHKTQLKRIMKENDK